MIILFLAVTLLSLLFILFTRSHKAMCISSMISSSAYFLISFFILSTYKFPVYFLENSYFFIDHLGLFAAMLSSIIFFFSMMYSYGYIGILVKQGAMNKRNLKIFYASINLLLGGLVFAFFSNNIALFWILVEITTFFSALLIALLNEKENLTAAIKYLLITSSAMLFAFVGIILLFTASKVGLGYGVLNFDVLALNAASLPGNLFLLAFIFIFIGFGAKAGVVPFHGWIPHAYSKAPSVVSSIMSTAVSFVGIYGIMRLFAISKGTLVFPKISIILVSFGLISIAASTFLMITRRNIKKLIGFSSVENTGIAMLLLGVGTPLGIVWLLFYLVAHSLSKVVLFLSSGILHLQYKSVHLDDLKNSLKLQKVASFGLIIGGISVIGFPLSPVFFAKLYMLIAISAYSKWVLLLSLLLFLIGGVAISWFMIKMFTQVSDDRNQKFIPHYTMIVPIVMLIILIIGLGVYFPDAIKNFLEKAAGDILLG